MKKLLTILLTLALALSLSLPALAAPAEEEYPMEEEAAAWMAAHPEEVAQMEAGLDAYARDQWYGDSVADTAEAWGLSEAYVRAMLLEEQVLQILREEERTVRLEEYRAAHPGVLEQFDADAWFQQMYGTQYRPPVEAFMEDYGLTTRQEFEDYMFREFQDHLLYMMNLEDEIDLALAEDPRILDGFDVDGYFAQEYSYYQTTDEFMADYGLLDRQEFETYLTWEYIFYYSGPEGWQSTDSWKQAMGWVPGQMGIMVNGAYLAFEGGALPYAERGVTYVPAGMLGEALGLTLTGEYAPLRETAEAAGYLVWWDSDFETAVLMDPAALAEAVDSRFTVLNQILNLQTGQRERWRDKERAEITFTLFDSLDGDMTGQASYTLDALFGPEGAQIKGEYELSQLLEQMWGTLDPMYWSDPRVMALLDGLEQGGFELRYDSATGATSLTASYLPDLLEAMGISDWESGGWITGEAVANQTLSTLLLMKRGGVTLGSLLAGGYENQDGLYNNPALYWGEAMAGADQLAVYLGDDAFTRQGNAWVLELDTDSLGWYSGYEDLRLTCTFQDSGAVSGSLSVLTPEEGSWYPATRLALSWNATADRGTVELEYHIKNQMKLVVDITSTLTNTTAQPETLPPEDAAVLPAPDGL